MKKLLIISISLLLAACSSPPDAPKVEWDKNGVMMNDTIPEWTPQTAVIKTCGVTGKWQYKISHFVPENRIYNDTVFYMVAHSDRIIVLTPNPGNFFITKSWLRNNGADELIEYRALNGCHNCSDTVYLIRK